VASLDDVVDDLYGGALDDFVARRDAAVRAAKAAKDKATAARIASLRKPTVAAWAVNLLVRDDPSLADALRDLGEGMRDAERSLDGPALRELGKQRRALVSGLVARARRLAAAGGQKLSTAASQEVEQTLTAALADPRVADAVAAGTLTHGTEHVGFGSADASPEGERAGVVPESGTSPARSRSEGTGATRGAGTRPGVRAGGRPGAAASSAARADRGDDAPGTSDDAAASSDDAAGSGGGRTRPSSTTSAKAAAEGRERARRAQEAERLRHRHEHAVAAREAAEADLDRARTRHEDVATAEQAAVATLEDAEREQQDAYAAEQQLVEALADVRRRLADARAALPRADEALVAARTRARDQEKAVRAAARELERATKAAERARDQEQRAADALP